MGYEQGTILVKSGPNADQLLAYGSPAEKAVIIAREGAQNCLDVDTANMSDIQPATTKASDYHTLDAQGNDDTHQVDKTFSGIADTATILSDQLNGFHQNPANAADNFGSITSANTKMGPEFTHVVHFQGFALDASTSPQFAYFYFGGPAEFVFAPILGFQIGQTIIPAWMQDGKPLYDLSTKSGRFEFAVGTNGFSQTMANALKAALATAGTAALDVKVIMKPRPEIIRPTLTAMSIKLVDDNDKDITGTEIDKSTFESLRIRDDNVIITPTPPLAAFPELGTHTPATVVKVTTSGGVSYTESNKHVTATADGSLSVQIIDPATGIKSNIASVDVHVPPVVVNPRPTLTAFTIAGNPSPSVNVGDVIAIVPGSITPDHAILGENGIQAVSDEPAVLTNIVGAENEGMNFTALKEGHAEIILIDKSTSVEASISVTVTAANATKYRQPTKLTLVMPDHFEMEDVFTPAVKPLPVDADMCIANSASDSFPCGFSSTTSYLDSVFKNYECFARSPTFSGLGELTFTFGKVGTSNSPTATVTANGEHIITAATMPKEDLTSLTTGVAYPITLTGIAPSTAAAYTSNVIIKSKSQTAFWSPYLPPEIVPAGGAGFITLYVAATETFEVFMNDTKLGEFTATAV